LVMAAGCYTGREKDTPRERARERERERESDKEGGLRTT
jgi:hypothetical protein